MERQGNEDELRNYKSFIEENGLKQKFEEFISSKKKETKLEEKEEKKEIEMEEKEWNEKDIQRLVTIISFSLYFLKINSLQKQTISLSKTTKK